MPADGSPFMSADLIATLADWIRRGCPNSPTTPTPAPFAQQSGSIARRSTRSIGHGALSHRQVRMLQARMGEPFDKLPHQAAFTVLMKHGGLPVLLDSASAAHRLTPYLTPTIADADSAISPDAVAQQLEAAAHNFFRKLVNRPGYQVNADLISYITFPYTGQAYENPPPTVSADVPAAFTFVGQFIDHDLTMNATDLFVDQTGAVASGASPLLDLDSVYGPRSAANYPDMIYAADGSFLLKPVPGTKSFDLPRTPMPTPPGQISHVPIPQVAHIFDGRNDENQLILQIHILIERVHNKLIENNALKTKGMKQEDVIATVRKEVVANWQTVVLQDYLTRVIEASTLKDVLSQIRQVQFGNLKYKPFLDLASKTFLVQLPHEWAIGFRFGHSQLRPSYHLNAGDGKDVKLFDNYTAKPGHDDLRGGVCLPPAHVIDWAEFFPDVDPKKSPPDTRSLRIDSKVTPPVFNLPESAIPDSIKTVGNLPQRNLIRGRSIGVVSGEELYDFYTSAAGGPPIVLSNAKLTPDKIAAREACQLFMHDTDSDGNAVFKTPLWYYILKEAELHGNSMTLGGLGSRLVAEVVAGAIFYDTDSVYFNRDYMTKPDPNAGSPIPVAAHWTSVITNSKTVSLRDLINFVNS